ncbi:MAG: hypothetical protein ACTSR8_13135 [Promethearchaeota archaeon]
MGLKYSNPFYLMKVGTTKGYGDGEALLWDRAVRPFVGVQHIMKRVQYESMLSEDAGNNWYPFGGKQIPNSTLFSFYDNLNEEAEDLIIYFAVIAGEYNKWRKIKEWPNLENLLPEVNERWTHWRNLYDDKLIKLPRSINLWGDNGINYYGLTIKNLEIYTFEESKTLNYKLEYQKYIRIKKNEEIPLNADNYNNFLLRYDDACNEGHEFKTVLYIIGQAKLIPPYIVEILP